MSKKREEDRSQKAKTSKNPLFFFLGIFVIVLLAYLVFVVALYFIDRIMPSLGFISHNRTGDAWFSVLGCLLPAVPSIILSLAAIWQTKKINMLDRKMHRPALAFQNAKLTAWYLNSVDYENCSLYKQMPVRQQKLVQEYQEFQADRADYCLLKIDLGILQKNEISVEGIQIEGFRFFINKKEYKFKLYKEKENSRLKFEKLKHKFENGIEMYDLQCMLIAFKPETEELWGKLYDAVMNKQFLNPCYEEFQIEVKMQIQFGLNEERNEVLMAKIYFCSEEGYGSEEEAVCYISSENGRLGYF